MVRADRVQRFSAHRWVLLGVVPAWLVGVALMVARDAPRALPAVNTVALALGLVLVAAVRGSHLARWPGRVGATGIAVIASSFAFASMAGVHRWISLGPVRLHPSAILAPVVLLSVVRLLHDKRPGAAVGMLAAVQAVHVLQVDAGQATALAAGIVALAAVSRARDLIRVALVVIAVSTAVHAWLRPDPLEAVPWVEGVFSIAFEQSFAVGVGAVIAIVMLPCVAWLAGSSSADRAAITAYLAGSIGVTLLGNFPVPVLGFGASPILGASVALGLLARQQET